MKYVLNIAQVTKQFDSLQDLYVVLRGLDVEPNEIDVCLADLLITGNNVAHFGIRRTFMWSEKEAA